MLSDLDIAQQAKITHIREIAAKININEDDLEYYGKYKSKLPLHLINEEKIKSSKLILVSAINPTPAGEGKTTDIPAEIDRNSTHSFYTVTMLNGNIIVPVENSWYC